MKVPLLVELYFGLSSNLELRLKRRLSIAFDFKSFSADKTTCVFHF